MAKGILALFLAFYVIALTLDPCADKEISCPGSHVENHGSSNQGADNEHKDLCSPFCTCNCCNISMEVASPLILPVTPVLRQTLVYFYEPQSISNFLTPIWQPPKV